MGSKIYLAGFLKGWVYLLLSTLALYLMVVMLETRFRAQAADLDEPKPAESGKQTIPIEAPALVDIEGSTGQATTDPAQEVVELEAGVVPAVTPEIFTTTATPQSEAIASETENSETEPSETDIPRIETVGPNSAAISKETGQESLEACALFSVEPSKTQVNQQLQLELNFNEAGAEMHAYAAGRIVKIHQSPYTGLTVYLLTQDGSWCLAQGGLQKLAEAVAEGTLLACGATVGVVGKQAYFEIHRLKPGQSWWQGKRLAPATTLFRNP